MEIKIPAELHLCGQMITINWEDGLAENWNRNGEATFNKHRRIKLDSNLPRGTLEETFFHECLHQLDSLYATDLKESQIKRLALGIAELVAQLQGG